jgi:lipase
MSTQTELSPRVAVALHGSADTPSVWRPLAAALGPRWQLVTPPLPTAAAGPGDVALRHDLGWLDGVMAQRGARVLVAHSYGALLALRWALAHPGALDRLVLAEPIAWGVLREAGRTTPPIAALRERCLDVFARGEVDAAMQWLVDYWNGAGFWTALPERVRVGLRAGAGRTAAEVASGESDRTCCAELRGLSLPVRLLAGAQTTPESLAVSELVAALLPDATLTIVPAAGHQFLRSDAGAALVAAALSEAASSDTAEAPSPSSSSSPLP